MMANQRWFVGIRRRGGLVLPLVVAVLLLVGIGQTVQATPVGQAGSAPSLVGAWVVHPNPDNPAERELAVFTADGLLVTSSSPSNGAPPPGEAFGLPALPAGSSLFTSQGYGVWEARGGREYAFRFVSVEYDQDGNNLGTLFVIDGNLSVDATGNTLAGTVSGRISLPDGSSIDVFPATPFTGTRLTVSSPL